MKLQAVLGSAIGLGLAALVAWPGGSPPPGPSRGGVVSVAGASSLTDVLECLARRFEAARGVRVRVDFASSGVLRAKIEAGSAPDVFVSASARDMDWLERSGRLAPHTRRNILRNRLVCVVPEGSGIPIFSAEDLLRQEVRRIAVGEPHLVPAGDYARSALERLGLGGRIGRKLAPCADVRVVLAQAEAGAADAAIVYRTDAKVSSKVRVAFSFPEESHGEIIYPVAMLKGAARPKEALEFIDYLAGEEAAEVFGAHGFEPFRERK